MAKRDIIFIIIALVLLALVLLIGAKADWLKTKLKIETPSVVNLI